MAASHTLPHPFAIPQISKLGVLTLYGYGVRVTMRAGHLQLEDGIGPERRRLRLPRVNHRLKRLVCVGDDGFVTLDALRWLSEIGASFVLLDRLGKVRIVTGPASPSEARLRRAQALALSNDSGVMIARELISAKLTGQETLAREKLRNKDAADMIAGLKNRLPDASDLNAIRSIEARAAAEYWNAYRDVPISFSRKDTARVPSHWLLFGTRHSPLTGGPRLSINPANSLLNFTFAVAASECRRAAIACGLDPALGFIHTDTANRDSLALDLIETIRPAIEAWVLDWLTREPLRRSDFFETPTGNCRISSALCSKLSETAPTWGRLVAPWAEFVAHALLSSQRSKAPSMTGFKTPLTQRHRREAKGAAMPLVKMPRTQHVCRGCGKPIKDASEDCRDCAIPSSTVRLVEGAKIGRVAARRPQARAKHSASASEHALARSAWDALSQPAWLTAKFFSDNVQPRLSGVSTASIRSQIGVSSWYASKIRQGRYLPHPRHWTRLAALAGFSREMNHNEIGNEAANLDRFCPIDDDREGL